MNITIPTPRLLPVTIAALACLLAMKSADMVMAAAPAGSLKLLPRNIALADAAAADPKAERPSPPPPSAAPGTTPSQTGPIQMGPAQTGAAQTGPIPATPSGASQDPPPVNDSERTVLLELRERRNELEARETADKARESLLTATEQKLTGRVEQLQELQARLEGLEANQKQREDASWQGLVKLYESMKPRDAAIIFNDLAMPTLLQIVDRMKDAKAALVLAAMNPDKARDLTSQLAQLRLRAASEGAGASGAPTSAGGSTAPAGTHPSGG